MGQLGAYFGQQVRAIRLARGLSQAKLAEAAGASEEWIRRIERGAARSPSFDTIEVLSKALGVTAARLFAGHGDHTARFDRLLMEAEEFTPDQIAWLEDAARLLKRAR